MMLLLSLDDTALAVCCSLGEDNKKGRGTIPWPLKKQKATGSCTHDLSSSFRRKSNRGAQASANSSGNLFLRVPF